MCILFCEQAVCRRGYEITKGLLVEYRQNGHVNLPFPGRVKVHISTSQWPETKTVGEWVSGTIMWPYGDPDRYAISLKEMIIYRIPTTDFNVW